MRHGPGQAGIGLLEVVIGVILLGLTSTLLIVSSRTSVTGQLRSDVYNHAAIGTKEVLENIQLMPLGDISSLRNKVMPQSQAATVTVRATSRNVDRADVSDFDQLDTSSLRHITLITEFKSKTGEKVFKRFSIIVFKP